MISAPIKFPRVKIKISAAPIAAVAAKLFSASRLDKVIAAANRLLASNTLVSGKAAEPFYTTFPLPRSVLRSVI